MKQLIFDSANFGYLIALVLVAIFRPSNDVLLPEFSRYAWISLGLWGVGVVIALGLRSSKVETLGAIVFRGAVRQRATEEPRAWWRTFWGIQSLLTFLGTFIASLIITEFSLHELFSQLGFEGAGRIFSALVHPNFAVLPVAVLAIIETIFMAFLATALAVPVAFVLGFFCARNLMSGSRLGVITYVVLRAIMNIARSIEPLIWAIIFSVWVGIGPFAGMLALLVATIASLAKQYSEMVESIDEGPVEGILATGAGPLQVVWFAVVPQIVLPYLSFTIYRWDINVRMSTIIGLVGGGGIGTLLDQYRGQALWSEVGCLALVIVITVWLMDVASAYIREALK